MKKFCIISHTHWDREWYMPFEVFRLKLVDLIDRLLIILEKEPDFIFHLDAQTIVLEDYLEIKPAKRNILKKHIRAGNIMIGPWYLQNDYMLTSGESTIRNLIIGTKIAKEFGRCGKVAYAPDQFGNVSQLPQILKNFEYDNFVFGRGFTKLEADASGEIKAKLLPTEFIWKGADGTGCLAVHLKQWYNNAQRFSKDIEKCKILLDNNAADFKDTNVTPYILLMNGVDHLEAQDDLPEVLRNFSKKYPEYDIKQYSFDEYMSCVKNHIKANKIKLYKHSGALCMGGDYHMLRGCWSSRAYLKIANVEAQTMLERRLEPLYSMLEAGGLSGSYPLETMQYLWKQMLKNHPHDSICGCSHDEIHKHMEDNYEKIGEISNELLVRGLHLLTQHSEQTFFDKNNYVITVVNTSEVTATKVVRATIDFPDTEKVKSFRILSADGKEVPYSIISCKNIIKDVFSPINLPGNMEADSYEIELYVDLLLPMSYRNYSVIPSKNPGKEVARGKDSSLTMENEYYAIDLSSGGADITIKATGKVVENAFLWEESGDKGDSYVYQKTSTSAVYSDIACAKAEVIHESQLSKTIRVTNKMTVPEHFDFKTGLRSQETSDCVLQYDLTVSKGCDVLEVNYSVINTCKDHRIRFDVKTGINPKGLITDSAFDSALHTKDEVVPNSHFFGFCSANYACHEASGSGVAVFPCGLHETESVYDSMLFTVIRATGAISRIGDRVNGGKNWEVPANQELRIIKGRLGFCAYSGDYTHANINGRAILFNSGLLTNVDSMDNKKFSGGRFGVQDSKLEELFYMDDVYKDKVVDMEKQFIQITNPYISISAYKKSEDGKSLILRVFNRSAKKISTAIIHDGKLYLTKMSEKGSKFLGDGKAVLSFRPKEIKTICIRL